MCCIVFTEAKGNPILPQLLHTTAAKNPAVIEARVNRFIAELQGKRNNFTEQEFLELIFNESHRRFFKTYKPYTQFAEIFEKGKYDCLSATSLLAVVLQAFEYNYQIIETNYHIFISVQTETGLVLLESTDRLNGFVTATDKIEARIAAYRQNQVQTSNPTQINYQFDLNLYRVIEPEQLPGLLLFNQAVVAFNSRQYEICAQRLLQAVEIYDSPRTTEFAGILVMAIANSNYSAQLKKELIRPFSKYVRNNAVASR
ncbi:MAG: hypothetical protein KF856_00770 [Cyclobacteriaceae bacterium]|nr:hypothetical protein [Cyclobacteriaceae bacterium]